MQTYVGGKNPASLTGSSDHHQENSHDLDGEGGEVRKVICIYFYAKFKWL